MKLAQLLANRFGAQQHARHIALLCATALLVYPSSFFLAAFYADALLVLGFVGAIYFALTKRLWTAVPFLILATACKVTGIVAIVVVAVIVLEQWWRSRGTLVQLIQRWLVCGLGFAGLAGYMAYSWVHGADPLLFYKAEKIWGREHSGFFLKDIIMNNYLYFFEPAHFLNRPNYILYLFMMILPLAVVGLGIFAAWKYKTFWPLLLGFLTVLLPLSTGLMDSLNRYCLVTMPLLPFAIIPLFAKKNRILVYAAYALLAVSAIALVGFMIAFADNTHFVG